MSVVRHVLMLLDIIIYRLHAARGLRLKAPPPLWKNNALNLICVYCCIFKTISLMLLMR